MHREQPRPRKAGAATREENGTAIQNSDGRATERRHIGTHESVTQHPPSDKGTHTRGHLHGSARTTISRALDTFDFVEGSEFEIAANSGSRKYERQYTSTKRRRR